MATRNNEKLAVLSAETGAQTLTGDAVDPDQVARLLDEVEGRIGVPDVVVHNARGGWRGPLVEP